MPNGMGTTFTSVINPMVNGINIANANIKISPNPFGPSCGVTVRYPISSPINVTVAGSISPGPRLAGSITVNGRF